MSLRTRKNRGIEYWVFTGGRENELHLGPVNDISKINSDRVLEALDYLKGRYSHYNEIEDKLISFLPSEKKDQYLLKRLDERFKKVETYKSSLSPSAAKQYKPEGLVKEDEETRRRLPEKEGKITIFELETNKKEHLKELVGKEILITDVGKNISKKNRKEILKLIKDEKIKLIVGEDGGIIHYIEEPELHTFEIPASLELPGNAVVSEKIDNIKKSRFSVLLETFGIRNYIIAMSILEKLIQSEGKGLTFKHLKYKLRIPADTLSETLSSLTRTKFLNDIREDEVTKFIITRNGLKYFEEFNEAILEIWSDLEFLDRSKIKFAEKIDNPELKKLLEVEIVKFRELYYIAERYNERKTSETTFRLPIILQQTESQKYQKLVKAGLCRIEKRGKNKIIIPTKKGKEFFIEFRRFEKSVAKLTKEGEQSRKKRELENVFAKDTNRMNRY